jgi:hypothetical protein
VILQRQIHCKTNSVYQLKSDLNLRILVILQRKYSELKNITDALNAYKKFICVVDVCPINVEDYLWE